MQSIFARGVYLGENTSQSASVEFVRPWRTNYARSRLQAFCPKWASPILDSGKSAGIVRYRRFCYRGEGGNQRSQADRLAVLLRFRSLGGDSEYKFIIHGRY